MILAGGYGTRLRQTVPNAPKALAPIGKQPFVELQIRNWMRQGINDFIFLLHYQAEHIIEFLKEKEFNLLKDCKVSYLVESTPLDTGGAVANAVKHLKLNDSFLVANADTWLGAGICELSRVNGAALVTVMLSDVSRFGEIAFNNKGFVSEFKEKKGDKKPGWINAGLYKFHPTDFKNWTGGPVSLEKDVLKSLSKKKQLKAVCIETSFIDIGVPEDYLRFCSLYNGTES